MDTIGKRLFDNTDMSTALASEAIDLNNMVHIGIHAVWTGAPTGDLYFEVSGQVGQPTVWEVFDDVPVSGSGSQFWIDRNIPYRWARVRYVVTAGTGNLTCDSITKGDK